jgi:hypothetical protein
MKIKIKGHAGNPVHTDAKRTKAGEQSGVQTSDGDKFHGDVVDLPKPEAGLLIAAGRAEAVNPEDMEDVKEKK